MHMDFDVEMNVLNLYHFSPVYQLQFRLHKRSTTFPKLCFYADDSLNCTVKDAFHTYTDTMCGCSWLLGKVMVTDRRAGRKTYSGDAVHFKPVTEDEAGLGIIHPAGG